MDTEHSIENSTIFFDAVTWSCRQELTRTRDVRRQIRIPAKQNPGRQLHAGTREQVLTTDCQENYPPKLN